MLPKEFKFGIDFLALWIIVSTIICGCDIPRDNPLDPKAYNYGIAEPDELELPNIQITSYHSSQWFPSEDIYSMEVLVFGASAETADSAKLVHNDTIFYSLDLSGNVWRQSLESSAFQSENLFDLIGVKFYANLYYGADEVISTEEACLYRIIEEVPVTDQPTGNAIVSPTPEFSWLPCDILYSYSNTLSINHISTSGFITVVAVVEDICSDSTSYTHADSLGSGSYYWTIAIVDIYNNISRSKESAFIVAP